ncbi:beta-galactosidase [Lactobacillus johnsonii]|uniref:Beta-galactosidase n=1 Tax=Lactobacillus johnsonii ATCC 33200 TaxID=525330 RepID=C2E5D5_LACJH|nr:beta-galactosidase [Lactobacillus johnsonii]EEJ59851.1 beta-galactosidase trimerization domain protein [Lactobacillus johnsonii ATCC 33200]KRK55196.1 beta-galactosidase [Lactobacillus johnsonii ATCC 33200]MCF0084544.1 beta-galactosidase [Lactobacillus johnsonii]MCT3324000.1 beta-galactosidase [Lactobacillus johnsonii]MCT3380836.1 beta-galactosidase [Lactobacillus johnsonii]
MTQLSRFLYGGDYNPEQWPEDTWANDIQVFKQAHLNSATINVFSWALLEQKEGEYDFSKLDKIVKELSDANFDIVLATATAAMPAWMFKKYPDVARVDYQGRRHVFGQRHNFCSNSKNYQVLASKLVKKIVSRYYKNPHIKVWHVNNEYGGNCYCDNCQNTFRDWLKYKYKNLETLNKAWNMNVWSHRIYDWDEIVVPNELGDAWGAEGTETIVSALSLDYLRFQSESLLKLFKMEKAIIKKYDPVALVTTNFHALPNKLLDYQKWAKEQDIISYDSYPSYSMPTYQSAFLYDLMRSLKHQPFMLMESTPAQVNWQPYSPLKRPGQMAATELQAVAHGADTVQFFQLKQAIGGSEKFHSAVISHSQRTDTRVFKEVTELGEKLEKTGSTILGSKTKAKVGIVFDWNNFWSYEYIDGITQDLDYVESILDYYKQLYKRNIPTDIISVDDDFSQYDLVVAPVLYMIKSGLAEKIDQYVKRGGNFVASYLSGIVNENDSVYLGGYPGPLKDVLGIWVEESDAVIPGQKITVSLDSNNYQANLICDLLHLEGAHALGNYNSEFYKETPAVSENKWGKGTSWYIGTQLDEAGLSKIFDHLISIVNIKSLIETKTDLEITKRVTKSGKELYFVLNMSNDTKDLPSEFDAYKNLFTDKSANKKMKAWEVQLLSKL